MVILIRRIHITSELPEMNLLFDIQVYWEIVHWHYLCGLTPDCLTPPGHISNCDKVTPNVTFCHRYDQSSLDILVTNSLSHNRTLYTAPENFILVQRYVTSNFPLKKCNTDNMSA